jgi:hypothetical protein
MLAHTTVWAKSMAAPFRRKERQFLLMDKAKITQFRRPRRKCATCGKELGMVHRSRKYCSTQCRPGVQFQRSNSGMTTTRCGAHSELIACAYLLREGYDVYRAVNWMSKADLVAVRGAEILRVQVRTGTYVNAKGTFGYVKPDGDDHDLLIVVDHRGNIVVEEYRAERKAA